MSASLLLCVYLTGPLLQAGEPFGASNRIGNAMTAAHVAMFVVKGRHLGMIMEEMAPGKTMKSSTSTLQQAVVEGRWTLTGLNW